MIFERYRTMRYRSSVHREKAIVPAAVDTPPSFGIYYPYWLGRHYGIGRRLLYSAIIFWQPDWWLPTNC